MKFNFLKQNQLLKLINRLPGTTYQYREWKNGRSSFTYCTNDIETIFFATPKELKNDGKLAWSRLDPKFREHVRSALDHSSDTLEEFEITFQIRSPQDRLHWIRNHAVPERTRDGGTRWFGQLENVTTQYEAKIKSEQDAALLETIFEALPDQFYYKDANCRMLGVNPACYLYQGFSSCEPLIGKTDLEIYSGENSLGQQLFENDKRLIETGEEIRCRERHERPEGVVYLESIKTPMRNHQGNIIGLVGISRDITHQVENEKRLIAAQEEAETASKAKSAFLAMMSHEIRTPMNGVIGAASLLLGTELSADQDNFVQTIQMSGEDLLSIINDILDYSKIEAGKIELEAVPFNLRECIENTFDLFVQSAAQKNLELLCNIEPEVPDGLISDSVRLRQIIVNLLANAIKFTHQGEVSLRVALKKLNEDDNTCQLQFSIRDTGIGISEEAQKRLFKSFVQADVSSTREYGGTGLGLAISKRLAELMGGPIWIESTEGVGTTFHFTIEQPYMLDAPLQRIIPSDNNLTNKRVLIVDDNKTNRMILCKQMNQWGAIPHAISHPEQVIDHLRQTPPYDIALLDYQMPCLTGADLAKEIQALPDYPHPPVIILSSAHETVEAHSSINTRMSKPVKMGRLLSEMQILLHNKKPIPPSTPSNTCIHEKKKETLRILIAEDTPVNQQIILLMLKRLGYEHTNLVENGEEAVAAAKDHDYDIILMDIQMPRMNGLDASKAIRANTDSSTTPWIIALTAGVLEDDRAKIQEAGINDFLAKPLALPHLKKKLSSIHEMLGVKLANP